MKTTHIGAVMLVAVMASCAPDEDPTSGINLDDPPTMGGPKREFSCRNTVAGEHYCHQDGDKDRWICEDTGSEPVRVPCTYVDQIDTYCWGARDTQAATCVHLEEIRNSEEGVEPGSYVWEFYKEREPKGGGGGGGGSCCRICTTGKACGDTCINRSSTCNTRGGCACNG